MLSTVVSLLPLLVGITPAAMARSRQ